MEVEEEASAPVVTEIPDEVGMPSTAAASDLPATIAGGKGKVGGKGRTAPADPDARDSPVQDETQV